MAEETLKTTSEAPKEEVMEVCDVAPAEKTTIETEKVSVPVPVAEETPMKSTVVAEESESAIETDEKKPQEKNKEKEKEMSQSVSFKEESNRVSDLEDPEKKALDELKQLIQKALINHEFTVPPPTKEEPKPTIAEEKPEPESEPKSEPEAEKSEPAKEEEKTHVEKPETTPETHEKVEESTPPPPTETVVVSETVVVDDDGAKTVEAIEETIVAVQPTAVTETVTETVAAVCTEGESQSVPETQPEEVFIWGIPLLGDEKSDVILLKFLRARDFKVKDAFNMIKNTVRWRKEFGIDALLEEDLGNDLEKVVFMHGFDKEGHPVCYNVYGEFQSKELYQKTFSDEEKRQKFLQWRIQFLEKSIRKLDFSPGGISTIVQINDLKNSPGPGKWELRQATNQALSLLQDNYPEFVAKQVFINVPWWYLAFYRMISPFLTHRTKSKFVFAGPSKSAETLFKYISPEQVPVQYGGLSKEGDKEFSSTDLVSEIIIKPTTKQTVEFPISENCVLVWEVRVVGWDVSYGAEFVPNAEDGYTVIVQKTRKISPNDEPVICNNFKIGEPGKVVLTIENSTSKKKKLLYRSKTKPSSD
ncbi:CRAL-TRIO domain [Macleaya cordata]|uniref:CRAL-TRIO domain n=1 Tax=Macleaya cordata TaxID=56857 RepID=A0A200Q6Q7_MACCD|nr:CRAL-TRIO domain [Macleaya cordata]